MKKLFILLLILSCSLSANAQAKGVKIGYIDMDYILENVPDYKEAAIQLEQKAQKWKQDIEVKKNEITKLEDNLKTERALLTKELIDEREGEIKFLKNEILDYQQKRFGPNGDLIVQKASIIKPVQDQVFNAVQDLAEAKKYDFIFDKSSDLTMLFSAKRYDVSDQIIRTITRSEKREQMSDKLLKAQEQKEEKENILDENPELADRKKALDDKKSAVRKALDERREQVALKKKELDDKRKKLQEELLNKKNGTTIDSNKPIEPKVENTTSVIDNKKAATDSIKSSKEAQRLQLIEKNLKAQEDKKAEIAQKKKEFEERRKKLLEEQEAKRVEKLKQKEQVNPKN
jgi:Skp family chaperone for outer membrane proteins